MSETKSTKCVLTLGSRTLRLFRVRSPISSSPTRKKRKGKESDVVVEPNEELCIASWLWSEVTAWVAVDDHRVLVGDENGRLVLVTVAAGLDRIEVTYLGQVSPIKSLTYLDNGVVFVGSHYGDSQLIKLLTSTSASNNSYVQVVETLSNLAPIMDAAVVHDEQTNQTHLVTCSGSHSTGSIRVVQKCAQLEQLGSLEHSGAFAQTSGVFPLLTSWNSPTHRYMLVSSYLGTKLLAFNGADGLEVANSAFATSEQTLAACNIQSSATPGLVWQITPRSVSLVDLDGGDGGLEEQRLDLLEDGQAEVLLAACSKRVFLVVRVDGSLLYGSINKQTGRFKPTEMKRKGSVPRVRDQPCALTVEPYIVSNAGSTFFAMAYVNFTVAIRSFMSLGQPNAEPLSQITLASRAISLTWTDFGRSDTIGGFLFAGCEDGTVAVAPFNRNGEFEARPPRVYSLGALPVTVTRGGNRVLACGSGAAVFHWKDGRVQQARLAIKEGTQATALNAPGFEDSITFVTPRGLSFARLLNLQKLSIRTIPLGYENPTRIVYSSQARAYGVGCSKITPTAIGEQPIQSGLFKVLDATTFDTIASHSLGEAEDVTSVGCASIERPSGGGRTEVFLVGTAVVEPGHEEPRRGYIIAYGDLDGSGFASLASAAVPGGVYAISPLQDMIVAAINGRARVYSLEFRDGTLGFALKNEYAKGMVFGAMAVSGNHVALSDMANSVTLLHWNGEKLDMVSKMYAPICPCAVNISSPTSITAATIDCNLYPLRPKEEQATALEHDGRIHLGETINRLMSGGLGTPTNDAADSAFKAEQIYVTTAGTIGVIAQASADASAKLYGLQRNLINKQSFDLPPYHEWRRDHIEETWVHEPQESAGFLDGDLLQTFLEYKEGTLEFDLLMGGANEAERIGDAAGLKSLLSYLEALEG